MCSESSPITQLVEKSKSIMDKWDKNSFLERKMEDDNENELKIPGKKYNLSGSMRFNGSPEITDEYVNSEMENGGKIDFGENKCDSVTGDDIAEMEHDSDEYEEYDEEDYESEYEIEYQDEHGNVIEIKEIEEAKFIRIDWEGEPTYKTSIETKEIQLSDSEDDDKSDFGSEDITFIVGYQNRRIKAHHKILCRESCVFRKFIYEDNLREIKVPDADPGDFADFLKCLYTRKQKDLSMISDIDEAFEISYLANKYKITRLVDKSRAAIQQLIDIENAATILEKAGSYKDPDLDEVAFEFICKNTNDVFQSKSFTQLSHYNLCRLLEQDTLTIDELPLFNAVYRWAVSFLNRRILDGNSDILRNALAEPLLLIRFNLMSLEDFVTFVCATRVLTGEKEKGICKYLSLPTCERNIEDLSAYLFKTNERYALYVPKDCYIVQRIPKREQFGENSDLYHKNAWGFSFQSNLPIYIVSLGIYGPKNELRMNCRMRIEVIEPLDEDRSKIISETEIEQNFRLYENIFHVTLSKPVKILPNRSYIIRFQILEGPMTTICSGALHVTETVCKNGEKVILKYGDYLKGFLTTTNQLPELMFRLVQNKNR